jgi:hypothetical protein
MNKSILLSIAVAGAFAFFAFATPPEQAAQPAAATPMQTESVTLANACRLTQLINEDKWDEVEKALDTKEGMIALLRKQHGSMKDWPGIGAYRGTRVDGRSPLRVTHRFGFAPRSNPHEIWLSYTITEKETSKPQLMVMGW